MSITFEEKEKEKKYHFDISDEDSRFVERYLKYHEHFKLDELNDANDLNLLKMLIRNEIFVDEIYKSLEDLTNVDMLENAGDVKKLSDLLRDAIENTTKLQKILAIDRKTRKEEETNSVSSYIEFLKRESHSFLEKRLQRVYCPSCKIMIGRYSIVHDHSAYKMQFQCHQCGEMIIEQRGAEDSMFDMEDKDWRQIRRAEIEHPVTDDIVITEEVEDIFDNFEEEITVID